MNEPKKNDSKKEDDKDSQDKQKQTEKHPSENPKVTAPVAAGEYKISFADPNNVIYQKDNKWYIKLKIENGEGHTGLVQVVSSSGSERINTKNAKIKNNILDVEFTNSFLGKINPNKKYKLGRIDITNLNGNKIEIRNFDPSISVEITPIKEGTNTSKQIDKSDKENQKISQTVKV